MQSQKQQNNLSLFPRQALFNITVIRVCVPTNDVKEAEDSQQKQDLELTVDQIMRSLLPNSGLN